MIRASDFSNNLKGRRISANYLDYVGYIDDAINKKVRFMVTHIKSRILEDKRVLDALLRYARCGGTIINLISRLDIEPFINSKLQPPHSIVIDDTSGVRMIAESIIVEMGKEDRVLLLKGPDTSETSLRRLEILSRYLIGKNLKRLDVENVSRWTAELAYQKINRLVTERRRSYDWIIAWNDEMALGVCRYYEENGSAYNKPKVIGFDKIPEAIEKINDSKSIFYRTVDMKMYLLGQRAAELLDLIYSGIDVPICLHVPVSTGDIIGKY